VIDKEQDERTCSETPSVIALSGIAFKRTSLTPLCGYAGYRKVRAGFVSAKEFRMRVVKSWISVGPRSELVIDVGLDFGPLDVMGLKLTGLYLLKQDDEGKTYHDNDIEYNVESSGEARPQLRAPQESNRPVDQSRYSCFPRFGRIFPGILLVPVLLP
jgi:hypothetical protein